MSDAFEQVVRTEVPRRLAELLEVPLAHVREMDERNLGNQHVIDQVLDVGPYQFILEWKANSSVASIQAAIRQLNTFTRAINTNSVRLIVVPYMGNVGASLCEEAKVSWMDLSGNAWIKGSNFIFKITGNSNKFLAKGRPSNPFANQSARIARWLLIHPFEAFSQRKLAGFIEMDEGFVSRITRRMLSDGLIEKNSQGEILTRNPGVLLDAWYERYRLTPQAVLRGHITSRSGPETLERVRELLEKRQIKHAATGLAAAWLYTAFAGFRSVSIYLEEPIPADEFKESGIEVTDRGANISLMFPKDKGVFQGAKEAEGVRCVHPVQAYLDLKDQQERSSEAAEELRNRFLTWTNNGH